jgi:nitroreductase
MLAQITDSQLVEALKSRYATKAFDPSRKLPEPVWAALQEALVLSASSFGLQPYRFVVVNDGPTRASLMSHAWNQRQVVDASHFVVFAARVSLSEAEIDGFLGRVVQVRGGSREALAGYRQMMVGHLLGPRAAVQIPHWATLQAYIALGNLLTSAAVLGVDTCPIEGFVPAEFDRILGLRAAGYAAVVCCALGYRSASDKYAGVPKVRLPASELVQVV